MLHDMPVGLVPGTVGLVAVSSPPDSVAIRHVPNHRFNMANVDCIRTFVRIHYPTGRRRTVATVSSPVVPTPLDSVATVPPDSVATVPPDSVATVPPDSVATAAASYCLPSFFLLPSNWHEDNFLYTFTRQGVFSHVYCWARTFFFGAHISRAEN